MRELRSSTLSARDKGKASEGEVKKTAASTTRSKKAEKPSSSLKAEKPSSSSTKPKNEKAPQLKTEKSWKTRGRIKANSQKSESSSSPKPEKPEKEEKKEEEEDAEECQQSDVKKEQEQEPEPTESKMPAVEPTADKENKSIEEEGRPEPVEQTEKAEEQVSPTAALSNSVKRKLTDVALEEEADEDSAAEGGMKSPTTASTSAADKDNKAGADKKKKTQPGKGRVPYDKESVEKAATSVIEGKMGAKQAAEQFGVSRSAVERRARIMRGNVPEYSKRRRGGDPSVQVIRVEDLD